MSTYRGTTRTTYRRHTTHLVHSPNPHPEFSVEAIARTGPVHETRTIIVDVDGAPCSFPLSMASEIVLAIEAAAEWLIEHHPVLPAGELPERSM